MHHIVSGNGFEISLNFVPRVVVEFINMQITSSTMAIEINCVMKHHHPPTLTQNLCVGRSEAKVH